MVALARVDPQVRISVFDERGQLVGRSEHAQLSRETRALADRARALADPVLELSPPTDPEVLRIGFRLRDEVPGGASSIVLEKPLTELRRDLRETRQQIVISIFFFVLIATGVTWFISRRYVGRPLAHLLEGMARVRRGDMRVNEWPRSRDEVGETQREFELLVSELEAARVRGDQEVEARRRIERGLQQADKLITLRQLSAVMAHEIGSPLQILEGRARALKKHADNAEATARTADLLIEQTARITGIVGQMLSITRRRVPRRTKVDAEALVKRVATLLELEAERRGVRLRVQRAGEPEVFADGDQLQQVALNLLRNALDAAPSGTEVQVTIMGEPSWLVMEVLDAGPGLAPSARARIFEPFFTTKADSGGTGLGLVVVRAIVQEHGGTVEFPDESERGCKVRVRLPRGTEGDLSGS